MDRGDAADDGFVTFDPRRRSTPDQPAENVAQPACSARPRALRWLPVAVIVACFVSLFATVTPASALIVTVNAQKYGVQPHATKTEVFNSLPSTWLQYGGGPVMRSNSVYAVYWDPSKLRTGETGRIEKYHGDWVELIDQFFEGVAAESGSLTNEFALTSQYTETGGARAATGTVFRGSKIDRNTYPSNGCTDPDPTLNKNFACLTDEQLRTELRSFIAANNLPAGAGTIFYMLTPPGLTVCTDGGTVTGHCSDSSRTNPWTAFSGSPTTKENEEKESYEHSFCSYHSATSTSGGESLLYAVIPWVAGTKGGGTEENLQPPKKNGADCQDGTEELEEPNQIGYGTDGYYDHALPDVLINQIAEQQIATITDPQFNGWFEPATGNEVPDQCRNWFMEPPVVVAGPVFLGTEAAGNYNQTIGEHHYYLNAIYNQAAAFNGFPGLRCEVGVKLTPAFSVPTHANSGEILGFDGDESVVTLGQSAAVSASANPYYRATFTWNFGDGTTVSGPGYTAESSSAPLYASVYHTYQYAGTYTVTLTIQDAGGNVSSTTNSVTVGGTARPSEGGGGGSGGSSGGSSSGSSTSSATSQTTQSASGKSTSTAGGPAGAGAAPAGKVVATQAIASHSLSSALSGGLVVRYSVSERAAGRFEVLLASSIARKLGLHGPAALGLAKGTAPQTVIGKAILATSKGGTSTYKLKLAKTTVARLRKLHQVSLMVRLVVRSSAGAAPTTVLDTVTLH
jgi:hypothetical protein